MNRAPQALDEVFGNLPPLDGRPIRVSIRKTLRTPTGTPVHAASAVRARRVLIEEALLDDRQELARIVVHELFHFVWVRLSNASRRSWETLLNAEWRSGARGELGWSSEWRKEALSSSDVEQRSRRWREYACESFCDSAAWVYSGSKSAEVTLAAGRKGRRREWFRNLFRAGERIAV